MHRVHRVGHPGHEPDLVTETQPLRVRADRFAFRQFHSDEGSPVLIKAGVEHLDDVGVIELCEVSTFVSEAGDHLRRIQPGLEHLERHLPLDRPGLFCPVHDTKPALAEPLDEPVRPDALRDGRRALDDALRLHHETLRAAVRFEQHADLPLGHRIASEA
ncbi:MAG: hypothetical protein Tsb0013_02000 [Phycisphaerales bacterium]